jgi:hypothetical protein
VFHEKKEKIQKRNIKIAVSREENRLVKMTRQKAPRLFTMLLRGSQIFCKRGLVKFSLLLAGTSRTHQRIQGASHALSRGRVVLICETTKMLLRREAAGA